MSVVHHARWWVRLRSGSVIRQIDEAGRQTLFSEVQNRTAWDPIVEIGWEPVGPIEATNATANGFPMVPNGIEPASVEVPEGVRDVLPPVETDHIANVGPGGQMQSKAVRAVEYRILFDNQPVLRLRRKE